MEVAQPMDTAREKPRIHLDGDIVDLDGLSLDDVVEFTVKGKVVSLNSGSEDYPGSMSLEVQGVKRGNKEARVEPTAKFAI